MVNQCKSPILALDVILLSELLQVFHVYPDSIHREPWGSLVFGGRSWWKEWARCQACYGCERFVTCHFGFFSIAHPEAGQMKLFNSDV